MSTFLNRFKTNFAVVLAAFLFASVQASAFVGNGMNGESVEVEVSENNIKQDENGLDKKAFEIPQPAKENLSFEESPLEDEEDSYDEKNRLSGRKKTAIVGVAVALVLVGVWFYDCGFNDGNICWWLFDKIYGLRMPKCFEPMKTPSTVSDKVIESQNNARALFKNAWEEGSTADKLFLIRFAKEQTNPFYRIDLIKKALESFNRGDRNLERCFREVSCLTYEGLLDF